MARRTAPELPTSRLLTCDAYDAPTGLLLLGGPGWDGIGSLDEWERRASLISAAVERRRAEIQPRPSPGHLLDALEREGV